MKYSPKQIDAPPPDAVRLKQRVVVWMNHRSHYQSDFFGELSVCGGVNLRVIYATELPRARRQLGWSEVAPRGYTEETLGANWSMLKVLGVVWEERFSTHIMNGIWSVPPFAFSSILMMLLGVRFFFHAEIPNPQEERRGATRILKRLFARIMIATSGGVFAIGARAVDYYENLDICDRGVHWFCYFSRSRTAGGPIVRDNRLKKIVFVGQLIKRKCVTDLVAAFASIYPLNKSASLILIGEGNQRSEVEQLALLLGLDGAIRVMGAIPPERVSEEIRQASIGVLPSAFDGWGIVVNEFLQAGVPVVVSSGCGAADVVGMIPRSGAVFSPFDIAGLSDAISKILANPDSFKVPRTLVEDLLGCESMTNRFLRVIALGLYDEL